MLYGSHKGNYSRVCGLATVTSNELPGLHFNELWMPTRAGKTGQWVGTVWGDGRWWAEWVGDEMGKRVDWGTGGNSEAAAPTKS